MKKILDKIKIKFSLYKIKLINYLYIKKLDYERRKYGYLYILLFTLSMIISLTLSRFIVITDVEKYKNLFQDTGIALIGLSGIIFTLQLFTQETNNNFTNSVMEKIVNLKFQHVIEYIYLSLITLLFIFIPFTSFYVDNINILLPFYCLSLIIVFIMLGTDLFISSKLSNKRQLILIIEDRINYLLDRIEKVYLDINKYTQNNNSYNLPLIDYISKSNRVFSSYIQCINFILRGSIADPLLFSNGMDSYIRIVKKRLEKRKNKLIHINLPFYNEILPTSSNDAFIEKYILEYLNEYAEIALKNNNRDIMQIIQNVYHEILLLGKNNVYINDGKLELTIIVTYSYYLEIVKKIVKMNNENMLFETVEVFKDLFINNGEYFYDLIDDGFSEFINEIVEMSLENKSTMNFRNIMEIANIPINCILISKDDFNYLKLDSIFSAIKIGLIEFTSTSGLIKKRDGARLYLQYIFNSADENALANYMTQFYNNNINAEGKYIECSKRICEILDRFINFYTSNEVTGCLKLLDSDNRFVTGVVDYRYIIGSFTKMLYFLIANDDYMQYRNDLKHMIIKCKSGIETLVVRHDSNGMRISEINDYYNDDIFCSLQDLITSHDDIKELFFDCYNSSLISVYDEKNKSRKNVADYFEYITLVLNIYEDDLRINSFIDWYFATIKKTNIGMIKEYLDLNSFGHLGYDSLSYEQREYIKEKIYIKIENSLNECNINELNEIALSLDLTNPKQKKKEKMIAQILEYIKK